MNRRLLLVLGLVALLAALAFYFLGRDRAGGGKPPAVAAGTTGGAGGTQSGEPGGSDGRALPDPRTKPRASIAGTVTIEDGGPLAGATVCTSWSAEGATADDTREPVCAKTDAAGGYKLTELVPGNHRLTAFAPQHVPEGWRDRDRRRDGLELQPGEARTGIDFALATGGVEISGVVEDVSGGPIADALVWVRADGGWWSSGGRAMTRSDAQGKFTSWAKAGEVSVWAQAEGYSDGSTEAVAPSKLVEVLLTPESVLAGIVVESGSKTPVEGAIVSVGDWRMGEDSSGASARTDAQGKFRLTRLRPGRYKPTAAAQGRYGEPTESVLLGLGQSVDGVVIEVHAAATVRGIVLIDDGSGKTTPCTDGWVGLEDNAAGRWEGDSTDPAGQIELTALLPGHYEVNVSCEGYLPQDKYHPVDVGTADLDKLVWTVSSGGRIRGMVKTSEGEPITDAHVSAETTGGAARGQRSWGSDQTEKDGTFLLKGLVAGEYALDVNADGERRPETPPKVTVPAGGEATIDIIMPSSGSIAGNVADTEGKPVRNARVRIANVGWSWGGGEGRTGDDGTFLIKGVKPGDRRVVATRGWWNEMRRPGSNDDDVQGERVSVAAGKTANVRLVVESRAGVISGKVTDAQGEPVVDAWVITSRESEAAGAVAGGASRQTRWQWGSDDRPVITATDGSFTVRELAPGTYAVRAFRRGGGEAVSEHVKLGATVALVIKSTGTISGTVKVAGGVLPDEVFISLSDEKTGFSRREKFFRTGGTFAVRDLPAGTFLLTADASAGRVMTTVVLAAGQSKTDVVLTLERKVTVRGRMVELGTGTPVPGLYANVSPVKGGRGMGWGGGGADKEHISGEDGRFEVKNAATGRVWVSGWPTDWENSPWSYTREVAMLDGTTEVVDVGDIEVMRKRKQQNDPEGDLGFTVAEQPPETEPEQQQIKVAHIRAGGPAARSGLQVGDVIVSVDGIDCRGANSRRGWIQMEVLEGVEVTLGTERGATVKIKAGPPL